MAPPMLLTAVNSSDDDVAAGALALFDPSLPVDLLAKLFPFVLWSPSCCITASMNG